MHGRLESCAHYWAPPLGQHDPAERLCGRGKDRPEPVQPRELPIERETEHAQ